MRIGSLAVWIFCATLITAAVVLHFQVAKNRKVEEYTSQIKIVTSIYPMYDFTKNICGEAAEITCLVPSETDFRDWMPSAEALSVLRDADIFIYAGRDVEPWLNTVLNSLSGTQVEVVNASDKVPEDGKIGYIWLNPNYALLQMSRIYDAVKSRDSENSYIYDMNMDIFKDRITNLDALYKNTLSVITNKNIYVTNDYYEPMLMEYGLMPVNVNEYILRSTEWWSNRFIQYVKQNEITKIYCEPRADTYALEELAEKAGVEIGVLNPFLNARDCGGYFNTMETNLVALKWSGQTPDLQE